MATAFEEALRAAENGTVNTPSFLTAADTLNAANNNRSFLESASDTVQSVEKFIGVSLISGVNQLYNIAPSIGNLAGGNYELSDAADVISGLDSNLGEFYKDHRESADLVGFMLSSTVPGIGGVKILNAGQKALQTAMATGKFGSGIGKSFGLLAPNRANSLKVAIEQVANNSSAASLGTGNALKAIGAGVAQNGLEALAFETAVSATLFESPILENQDFGDFATNVAIGAGLFGIIGGALDATKINSALKGAANKATLEARPWTAIDEVARATDDADAIALDLMQIKDMPAIPDGLPTSRANFLKAAADSKVSTLEGRIRNRLGNLAKDDEEVAGALSAYLKPLPFDTQLETYMGLENISRMGHAPRAVAELERVQQKLIKGELDLDSPELAELISGNRSISYARIWGDDAGRVIEEKPRITALIDTLSVGEKIKVDGNRVLAGDRTYKFSSRYNTGRSSGSANVDRWDIMEATPLETQARYIWAAKSPQLSTVTTKGGANTITVDATDIPMLEKLMRDIPDAENNPLVKIAFAEDSARQSMGGMKIRELLEEQKVALAIKLGESPAAIKGTLLHEEIASIVNVRPKLLNGDLKTSSTNTFNSEDLFALQSYADEYAKTIRRPSKERGEILEIWNVPQHIRTVHKLGEKTGRTNPNFVTENLAIIKQQQKQYQASADIASKDYLGEEVWNQLIDLTPGRVRTGAVPSGAGAKGFTAASNNYGSLAADMEFTGSVTSRAATIKKDAARELLEPSLYKLSQNQEASVEWANLHRTLRSLPGEYTLDATGTFIEPVALRNWKTMTDEALAAGTPPPARPTLHPDTLEQIAVKNSETIEALGAHIEVNGKRTTGLAGIRATQGVELSRSPLAIYPVPVNPKDFKHFAMVIDESVTGAGRSRTLFASSEDELQAMVAKVKENPQYTVKFKKEAEQYYKDRGQWDYEKTLNSNYMDTEAERLGASSPFTISTDPQKIVDDALSWHMQRETGMVREAVSAKYEIQFEELRRLGDDATAAGTSKFSDQSLLTFAEESGKNPYADYIKTALAIKKDSSYPWWVNTNRLADQAVSTVLKKAHTAMLASKSDADMLKVNNMLEKAGYKGAAYDANMEIFANAQPARGALLTTVQKANSILATVVLRLDPLNAMNNAISANVLLGAETKAVVRAIARGDEEAAGALAKISRIGVPGTGESIMSPTKMIAESIKKLHTEGLDGESMRFFRENGYITSISKQYRDAVETLSFSGRESVSAWNSRVDGLQKNLSALGDKGELWTGNKLAEEFNRFVAADVMKQMTDVAVTRGLMTGKEQLAYINTFVNRTQGNYLASQRPMAFQGAIGQAVGLFQTYQFNLMQQLLRHVGEGQSKDVMTLLGLQATIHGMNGLPGFNAANTHIIGTASGNTAHKDAYDAAYGIVGKEAGDWLVYGAASNAFGLLDPKLKVNLYTRGDINPRNVTLLPINPANIPFIQATTKVFKNLFTVANTLGAGGDVTTSLLQGLEHNGISRPLAGLAQTLKGLDNPEYASYSTSKRGNVIAANDLLSLANAARIVGGKPLDEAIALDASYRFRTYALADSQTRNTLGLAIKSTMLAGDNPSQDQVEGFAQKYAEAGGRQEEFAGWFANLYKNANTSQANALQRSLSSPFTESMQRIMGGEELRDFSGLNPTNPAEGQ